MRARTNGQNWKRADCRDGDRGSGCGARTYGSQRVGLQPVPCGGCLCRRLFRVLPEVAVEHGGAISHWDRGHSPVNAFEPAVSQNQPGHGRLRQFGLAQEIASPKSCSPYIALRNALGGEPVNKHPRVTPPPQGGSTQLSAPIGVGTPRRLTG
jgi:hypothetical protein